MKYLYTDFSLLQSIPQKSKGTLGSVYEALCIRILSPMPTPSLLISLRRLSAGGYVTVEPSDGILTASTPISLTDKGLKAVTPSWLGKLLNQPKAIAQRERAFCELDMPEDDTNADWQVEAAGFDAILRGLYEQHLIPHSLFEITREDEGYVKLTVHHPGDEAGTDEGEVSDDPDAASLCRSASVTSTEEQIQEGLRDLIDTAYLLVTEAPRPRKIAIHGVDRSLLISMAQAAAEQEGYVLFRVTVSQIRFNRRRFVGKRDGDLDYAQCGDPILTYEASDSLRFCSLGILPCAVVNRHLLDEQDLDKLSVLYRHL